MIRGSVLGVVLAAAGCTSGPGEEVATPEPPVGRLAEAPNTPWVQQVWWQGAPGERVEGVTTVAGHDDGVVLGVVAPDGRRRAVFVQGPGREGPLPVRVPELSRGQTSDLAPDGRSRVSVERAGEVSTLVVRDTIDGGARVLVRDPDGALLRHPSVLTGGEAVFVDEGRVYGGIWRVDLTTGAVVRVVDGVDVATPVALGGERPGVAFVREAEGLAPALVVARDLGPPVAGVEADGAWWPAASLDGQGVRLVGCDGEAPLRVTGGELRGRGGGARVAGRYPCGAGCVGLAGVGPGGAPTLIAERWDGATVRWWTDAQLGVPPASAWTADASLPAVRGCPPALAAGAWITRLRFVGEAHDELLAVEVRPDRLLVHGRRRGRQAFVGTSPDDGGPWRTQLQLRGVEVDASAAVSPDGSREVVVEGGVVRWRAGGDGPLWAPEGGERVTGAAFTPDGAALVVTVDGAAPRLMRVGFDGVAQPLVAAAAPRGPVARGGPSGTTVAWIDTWNGRPVVAEAWLMPDDLRAAWDAGVPGALVGPNAWTGAQERDGAIERCTGADVGLTRVGDGVALRLGEHAVPVVGALREASGGVTWLGATPYGAPVILAEGAPAGEGPGESPALAVRDLTGAGSLPSGTLWLVADEAGHLVSAGPCRPRG